MKKLLCKIASKLSNGYAGMSSNASWYLFAGQTKAPKCLIKKD